MRIHRLVTLLLAGATLFVANVSLAKEDIEFTAEHLPEVGVDNRFATLPLWGVSAETSQWSSMVQLGFTSAGSGSLQVQGPMLSLGLRHVINDRLSIAAFTFYDDFRLTGKREQRPLQTLFSPQTPIERPANALFTGLNGQATDYGVGLAVALHDDRGWLREHRWIAGLLWQRIELRDYRFNYEVLEGASRGVSGQLDFDATYQNLAPFVGLELIRRYGNWTIAPHALFALPIPRRGFAGHITGPGFDLTGDSARAGNGEHFGDSSLTVGVQVTYQPANLSIDLGTIASQAVLVPVNKHGITRNLLVSIQWMY